MVIILFLKNIKYLGYYLHGKNTCGASEGNSCYLHDCLAGAIGGRANPGL